MKLVLDRTANILQWQNLLSLSTMTFTKLQMISFNSSLILALILGVTSVICSYLLFCWRLNRVSRQLDSIAQTSQLRHGMSNPSLIQSLFFLSTDRQIRLFMVLNITILHFLFFLNLNSLAYFH